MPATASLAHYKHTTLRLHTLAERFILQTLNSTLLADHTFILYTERRIFP